MPKPVPGLLGHEEAEPTSIEFPFTFYANMRTPNTIVWNGQVFEVFIPREGPNLTLVEGDRVRCARVDATQQIIVLEKDTP